MILIYVTCTDGNEAWTIGHKLVDEKLAACTTMFPSRSIYWWEGRVTESSEEILLVKTTEENFDVVKKKIEELHSYETPCILRIDCHSSEKFTDWMESCCGKK